MDFTPNNVHHSCEDRETTEHGTEPYMTQEILLEEKFGCATMEDLKAIAMWILDMICLCIINPEEEFPNEIELNSNAEKPPAQVAKYIEKMLREKIAKKSKPQLSIKYINSDNFICSLGLRNCIRNA